MQLSNDYFNSALYFNSGCTISLRGESAKVEQTCKVGQVVNLQGHKFEQPGSCVVLSSICKINFYWVFLYTLWSPKRLNKHLSDLHVRTTFADSPLYSG